MDLFRDERIKEMNNANTSINELANERATVADIKAKAQQEADKYNEVKNAIAEPLATSFLHPTAIKLLNNYVKPGVKKVLGRATQEVSEAAKEIGYDFSGVEIPNDESGLYSLRYSDFTVPLVKAVQEQQIIIDELKKENESLRIRLEKIEALVK